MANEKIVNRENLKAFRKAFQEKLENGQIIPTLSKNLDAVSEESGITQETPFILQGTGTANGTASVDTSPIGKQLEKQGNSVVVNQGVANSDKSGSIIPTGSTSYSGKSINSSLVANNTYLIIAKITNTESRQLRAYCIWGVQIIYGSPAIDIPANSTKLCIWKIKGTTNETYFQLGLSDILATQNLTQTWSYSELSCIDLTQWFNGDIPQDLLDNPSNFFRYYNGSLAYNTGTLENSTGRYLECGGRQLWDEEWEVGTINNTTGQNVSNDNIIRSKNYISVIPNKEYYYYGGNFVIHYYDINKNYLGNVEVTNSIQTTPNNAYYMRFRMSSAYGDTYNNDITISLYYATGEGYDKYYAYVEPKVYDTGTEILRSAGSVKDIKLPSGEITKKVGYVDLSTLTFVLNNNNGLYESEGITSLIKIPTITSVKANITCSKYSVVARDNATSTNESISINSSGKICVKSSSSTITGTLNYELNTYTTEQGAPFVKEIEIDDYGTMGWKDTNNAYVDIPQGCKIFYPANVADLIDSLGQREDIGWDASEIVSQEQLGVESTARSSQDTIIMNAVGDTLRQCLCVKVLSTGGTLLFNKTNIIDASELNWVYSGSGFFYVPVGSLPSDFKQDATNGNNILCSKYQSSAKTDNQGNNLNIYGYCSYFTQYLYLKDNNYNDVSTLKQALKGVLLAYEKA